MTTTCRGFHSSSMPLAPYQAFRKRNRGLCLGSHVNPVIRIHPEMNEALSNTNIQQGNLPKPSFSDAMIVSGGRTWDSEMLEGLYRDTEFRVQICHRIALLLHISWKAQDHDSCRDLSIAFSKLWNKLQIESEALLIFTLCQRHQTNSVHPNSSTATKCLTLTPFERLEIQRLFKSLTTSPLGSSPPKALLDEALNFGGCKKNPCV